MDEMITLLDVHGNAIYSFCLYLAKNKQDGEDLFQETFIRAMEIASRIDMQHNPKSYLMSIAINIWRNTIQKRTRRRRIMPMAAAENDDVNRFADIDVNIEAGVINKIMNGSLLEIVNKLDDRYRIPILLFYAEDMKISEIASLLCKPEGTIKRLLHEAKKKIKKGMEAMGYE